MKIKDIKYPKLKELALKEQERQNKKSDEYINLDAAFFFSDSEIGKDFWLYVYDRKYSKARKIFDWDKEVDLTTDGNEREKYIKRFPSGAVRSDDKYRTFESGSKRDNDDDKPLVNHLDSYVRLRFGYHLRKGANHYGKNNWKLGQPTETAIESLNRHLALYENGCRKEDHLSAIIFNVQLIMKNEEKDGIEFNHYFKK